jgi:hypothetical protein
VVVVTQQSDGRFLIEVKDIIAQLLDDDLSYTITGSLENGESFEVNLRFAPLAYVNALYGTSATGTDLAVAFYRYYEAVRAINGN